MTFLTRRNWQGNLLRWLMRRWVVEIIPHQDDT